MNAPVVAICPKRGLRRAVAEAFGVEEAALVGRGRTQTVVLPRYAYVYILRQRWPLLSYPRIGVLLGGRDHSTIIHGLRNFNELLARDPALRARVDGLLAGIPGAEHNAHVLAWLKLLGAAHRAADRRDQLVIHSTIRTNEFTELVARKVADLDQVRAVKEKNRLAPDDVDALRRKSGSDALGRALAKAGGWR